jgi:hypothetical protein
VDGDKVTITSSAGSNFDLMNAAHIVGGQLQQLELKSTTFGAEYVGANIAFTVVKGPSGDGLANVGLIDATGVDLGKITIHGDLGQILAGDSTFTTTGVKSLTLESFGRLGTDTGAKDLKSQIVGPLDALKVKGDVKDVEFVVQGKIGSITIGGSLIGGAKTYSGNIYSNVGIGPVKIGGDLQGGSGGSTGEVVTNGRLASLTIGGSVLGGTGSFFSGSVNANQDIGFIKIGGDLQGGTGFKSGLLSGRDIGKIIIGGSIIGGTENGSGTIAATNIGALKIGKDLHGGSIGGTTGTLDYSGSITASHHLGAIVIRGSIIAGIDDSTVGDLTHNATIKAGDDISSLTVGGSIVGHNTPNGVSRVEITARGQATPGASGDIAIGKITVGGRVEYAEILGGYNFSNAVNADAQIGKLKIGGDWIASSVVAGAIAGPFGFGLGDAKAAGAGVTDSANLFSKIARITIGGQVIGTPDSISSFDNYGFVAEELGALKVGGNVVALIAGQHNDNLQHRPDRRRYADPRNLNDLRRRFSGGKNRRVAGGNR